MKYLMALLWLVACTTAPAVGPVATRQALPFVNSGPNLTVTVNPGNTPPQSVSISLTPAMLREIENDHPFAISGNGEMFAHKVNVNIGIVP